MFLKFKKGKQKEIINKAIDKAGSERKLIIQLGLSKGAIWKYKTEKGNIPKDTFIRLLSYLGEDFNQYKDHIIETLPINWGQVKGGINCVKIKKEEGTFHLTIDRLRKVSSKRMKKWHKDMRENSPIEYYKWQYERFKKVDGGYCYFLNDNTPVRNQLEKTVGDFLIFNGFNFEYEPFIMIRKKAYFPDFKIGKKIIEVTGWKHPSKEKIDYLKKKVKDYIELGLEVKFFIPNGVRKFYKWLGSYVVSTLPELKGFIMPP